MNDPMLLAHAQALLTTMALVHADERLTREVRLSIVSQLLECTEDTDGATTLDALSAIFEDFDDVLPVSVVEALAALTNSCHALGKETPRDDARCARGGSVIPVTANTERTRACQNSHAATYDRPGQPKPLPVGHLSDIRINDTITVLCPGCLVELLAGVASRQQEMSRQHRQA